MNRVAAVLIVLATSGALPGCAGLNDTQQRALTGTGVGAAGGAVLGAIGGSAGLGALAVAGAGLAGGLLFDSMKKSEVRPIGEVTRQGARDIDGPRLTSLEVPFGDGEKWPGRLLHGRERLDRCVSAGAGVMAPGDNG